MDRSPLLMNSDESRVNSTHRDQPGNSLVELPRQTELPVIASGGGNQNFSDNSGYLPRQEGEGINFQQLLAIALRRWPIMLAVFAIVTALGVVSAFTSRPMFQSASTIELAPARRTELSDIPGMEQFFNASGGNSIGTQIEILRGATIRRKALSTLSPATQKILAEFHTVEVAQVGNSNLLAVAVKSYSPTASGELANAIGKQFEVTTKEKNQDNTQGAIRYIKEQLGEVQKRYQAAQEKLKNFKQKTGIFDLSREGEGLASQLASLQSSQQQVTAERAATEARLNGIRAELAQIPASRVVESQVGVNPIVETLQARLADLETERSVASKEFTPSSVKMQGLDREISSIKSKLSREAKTKVTSWQPDPSRQPLVADAANTQAMLWSLDARIKALDTQVKAARQSLSKLPEHEFRFSQLSSEAEIQQQTSKTLNERLSNLLIGVTSLPADGRLVFEAGPGGQVGNSKGRIIMYGAVVGIMLAFGVALLLDMADSRIYSDEEAQRVTGLPVLTHVPLIRESQMLSPIEQWQTGNHSGQLLESYRLLRANISFSSIDKPIRTLAVTSSLPSEGKSHTAVNLAIAAATGGDRVILVDLDLRRPTIHRLTHLTNRLGFTSVAGGHCSLEDALQETEIPGLSVLTSGPLPPSPFKILNSRAGRSLIEQLGQYADLVVIDAPPVLGMVDARLIASWVDGTVLVISCKDVGRREVARSTDSLIQGGAELLGTVLSKVPQGVNGSYNYYGYRYNQLNSYYENGGPQEGQESSDGSTPGLVRTSKNS